MVRGGGATLNLVVGDICLSRRSRGNEPYRNLEEEGSRQREQHVQSPWGRGEPAVFTLQQGGPCGWIRDTRGWLSRQGLEAAGVPLAFAVSQVGAT